MEALHHYLGQTLSPAAESRKEAENYLKSVEGTQVRAYCQPCPGC
jgi:hypothetical protein